MEPNNENSVGPVIAIIIVLAMIILGGLYFWGERTNDMSNIEPSSATVDEITASITSQSSSDDISSIEEDLSNTNVIDLGSDLESL